MISVSVKGVNIFDHKPYFSYDTIKIDIVSFIFTSMSVDQSDVPR